MSKWPRMLTTMACAGLIWTGAGVSAQEAEDAGEKKAEAVKAFKFMAAGDAPQFELQTLEGKPFTHETQQGKLTVLEFWATWCPPCVAAMPHTKALYERFGPKGIEFVGISYDKTREDLDRGLEDLEVTWPQVFDPERQTLHTFGVGMLPRIMILDPQGVIAWSGHPNDLDAALWQAIEKHRPDLYDSAEAQAAIGEQQRRKAEQEAARAKAEAERQAAIEVRVGSKPDFDLEAVDGGRITDESLRGKLVIVDFWATWCGPCMAAMPHMKELYAEYKDQGVEVLGISLDRDMETLRNTIAEHELAWLHHYDKSREMSKKWGVSGIPTVFILSPEGEVLWRGHPMSMDEAFEKALKEHPPKAMAAAN